MYDVRIAYERGVDMARTSNGNGDGDDGNARMSITVDPSLRRKIRLAAALNDESIGEWCARILETYADKAVEDLKGKVKL